MHSNLYITLHFKTLELKLEYSILYEILLRFHIYLKQLLLSLK